MLEVKRVSVDSLQLDPRNARKHDDKNLGAIKGSLTKFGQVEPLVVNKATGVVIGGNGRLEAMRAMGASEVDVVEVELNETDAKALALALNRTAELAEWDSGVLTDTLRSLKELDFDIDSIGFADFDLSLPPEEGKTDPDAVPENVETRCKPGDLWLLGKHKLLCGDSTDVLQVERLMGGEKADFVYMDPPYGMKLDTDFSSMKSQMIAGAKGGKHRAVAGDDQPFDPSLILVVFESARELFLWGADYYAERILDRNAGSWAVWDKRASQEYLDTHEDIPFDRLFGSSFELCWSRKHHKRELARVPSAGALGHGSNEKRVHPTQKPVALAEWFFSKWGKPDDLVADLFLGSGSTLIACEKTGRRCFGMEIDPKYCDVILARWEAFTGLQASLIAPEMSADG